MAKSVSKPKTGFYVVIGILLVLVAVFAVLYAQTLSSYAQTQGSYSSVKYNYSVLQSNYNTLKSNYITEKVNFSSLQAAYNNLSEKYNITEYNLTHPYTKVLYNDYLVSIPAGTYNYYISRLNNSYRPGEYNFSFVAKYPGYLVINGTSSNSEWLIALTENNATLSINNTFKENAWFFNYPLNQSIAPTQQMPIIPGKVHVYIFNYNSTNDVVTFSATYVGFHTS